MAGGRGARQKGNGYERELVHAIMDLSIQVERTWGSNGRTRGLHEAVDLVFGADQYLWDREIYGQAKRAKKIPAYIRPESEKETLHLFCKTDGEEYQAVLLPVFCKLYKREPVLLIERKVEPPNGVGKLYKPEHDDTFGQFFRQDRDKHGNVVVVRRDFFLNLISNASS